MKTLASLLLLVGIALPAHAQETRARITGAVVDGQGSVVPGVTVTALNLATNVGTEAVTNASGLFTIQQLQPGPYRVTAALQGFKTFSREGIELHTAETVTVNVQLSVGAIEETITVSAEQTAIESNESTVAQTIENKRITELPLNGRQVYMLMQLTAGTIFTQTTFGATGFSGTRAWDVNGSLSVHGSRTGNNEYLMDGAPSSGTGGGTGNWNFAPPVDAIEEFKIGTSAVDASYGRTSGGVINMTLRSGTNQMRGSGIVLHRGTWLDSNQIQNIRNNISNEGHKYYNAEGMMSGPIVTNRTFFMGGYQGFYENIPFPVTRTVPSDAQLRGDFSQTTTANGTPIIIYDPATTACNANLSSCTRQPFPGNIVPENRWHPIARALLPHIPRPNATPSNLSGSSNFISSPNIGRYRYNAYLARFDHIFSQNHRLSASNSGNWGIEYRNENALPEPAIRSDNYPTHRNHYLITVDDNYTINSSTLWNTRVSWDRFDEPHDKVYGDVNPNLPFTGPYQLTGPPFPQINPDGYEGMFPRTFRQPKNDAYSINSNVSKAMGKHFLKVGGEYRAYQFFRFDEVNSNGTFSFSNEFTRRDPLSNTGAASGNGLATFLLGLPTCRQRRHRYAAHRAVPLLGPLPSGRLEDRLAPHAQRRRALGLSAGGHRAGRPHGIGVRLRHDESTAVAAAAGLGDDQSGHRSADDPRRRPDLRESRRAAKPVQERLEQLAAACRRYLPRERLVRYPGQLRPVVPRAVERRTGRRLHDRLPADDAVHRQRAERHRSGNPVGESVPRWLPAAARRRAGTADGARHNATDPEC